MKPFNLEAAKAGAKLITRDGREVIDFHHFAHDASSLCICAHIKGKHGPEWFDKSGSSCGREADELVSSSDLFMATTKRTVYVNLYAESPFTTSGNAYHHDTEGKARGCVDHERKTLAVAVPVEIEE
jgi:hypothetical protein